MTKDLTTGNPMKLILAFALPTLCGMLFQQFYNLVDTMIVGKLLGAQALAAVGSTGSINFFVIGFCMGVCNGFAIPVAQRMGAKEYSQMRRFVVNAAYLSALFALVLTVATGLFCRNILVVMRTPADIIDNAYAYIFVIFMGIPATFLYNLLAAVIRSLGDSKTPVYFLALSSFLNIFLDFTLILYFKAGVAGAALATVISQAISAAWVLKFLTGRRALLTLKLSCLPLQARRVKRIVALGLSGFFMNMTNSLVQIVCNATLQSYGGDLYVGVMTIINSLREVFFMPVHGLSNGAQPVMGFNYGAGLYSRVRKSIRFSCGLTVAYAAAFWAAAMLLPELMIRVFNSEPEVIAAGVPALRVYFALFIPMSLQSAGQSVFVALGRSKQAVFFSLLRKAIINAPLTVILPIWMDTMGVFYAEAASQLIGGLACFATMYFTLYRPLGRIKDGEALPEHL